MIFASKGTSFIQTHFLRLWGLTGVAFVVLCGVSGGVLERAQGASLVVSNPPPIQMFVPGFTVRELPLDLNNINNLVYAPDGRLFALGYDGDVFQLKDTDGDGLEDTAVPFFKNENNEIPPSIGMCWGPGGLYIASQKRVIRLRDKGDGSCELQTVASGWVPPAGKAGSDLDSIGIAVDKKGQIFFGLGCDNWQSAYRVNKNTLKSEYDVHSERGTILKVSRDWKKREVICTGVRFTVSLAFNSAGDLFCTDQEGATWLPNGNPFDELLHVRQGRHYGFPPRHPKYLPAVIDEPSTFDYGPQHQSTCGLHFNEPVAGDGKVFGPAWWRGDAIVAGESRGKIWRTALVKTAAGYVAKTELIACLNMLTIDAVPTPQGDLIVTCHSGKPDWGTGPKGKGKLFKISYSDQAAPQPVLAYAASPTEFRIIFDRPLDPTKLKNVTAGSSVTFGRYVTAGDRFESFRPGYQAVQDQLELPRFDLPVLSAAVTPDNRALIFQTPPHREALNYSISLPDNFRAAHACDESRHELPQAASVDLMADLTGVEASWRSMDGKESWTGWLPHVDLEVARAFASESVEHRRLFLLIKKPGTLRLRTQLDLWQMLHPAVQPGAKLDFEYPPEITTVSIKANGKLEIKTTAMGERLNSRQVRITQESMRRWVPIEMTLVTGGSDPKLEMTWSTDEDSRARPFPLRRFLLPWASAASEQPVLADAREIPEVSGGDWERGKKVFFSEPAICFKCHQAGSEGGKIGPDLSNLVYRDYASVVRDITQPSAAINPDHLAYMIDLKDGETVTGVLLEDTQEKLVVGQVSGEALTISKARVASIKPSSVSLMPEGLLQALNQQQQKDLLTFLLTKPSEKNKSAP